jgi:transcription antitermination factor NusG
MSSLHWYTLRVKPHKERIVCGQLQAQEVEFYYPAVRVKPVNPRSATVRPFFPGYLFVRTDLAVTGQDAFHWLPGVHGLVAFGGTPPAVTESLIFELKRRLKAVESAGGWMLYSLQPGDRVRIVEGPLAGYEAIFDAHVSGEQRVRVLLAFLSSQPQPVELDAGHVQKVQGSRQ